MNPRPIVITSRIAVLFVAAAYFGGKWVLESKRIEDNSSTMAEAALCYYEIYNPEPTTPPSDTPTPNTHGEHQTSETTEPAPTADTEVNNATQVAEKAKTPKKDKPVSLHGFRPYPKLPSHYPDWWSWKSTHDDPEMELLEKVRIKLLNQGVDVRGAGMENGKVYPTIPGTVYIRWANDGMGGRYIMDMSGHPDDDHDYIQERLEAGETPSGITVLEYDEAGINPYEYLDLQ